MKLDILMKLIALANNNPNDNEANLAARKACKAIIEHKFVITGGTTSSQQQTTTPPKTPPRQPNTGRDPFWDFVDFDDIFGRRGRGPFSEGQYTTGGRRAGKNTEQQYRERQQSEQRYRPKSEELKEREHTWQYEYYVAATKQFYNPLTQKHYNKMFQDLWFQETGTRHVSDTAAFRASANYGSPEGEGTKQHWTNNPYTGYNKTGHPDDEAYYRRRRDRGFGDDVRKLRCKTCGKEVNTKFVGHSQAFECNDCQWTAYQREKGVRPEEPPKTHKFDRTCRDCKTPISCIGSNYCNKRGTAI